MTQLNKIIMFALILLCFNANIRGESYTHLIMYGQSLSEGYQSYPPLSVDPLNDNYMIGEQVWINRSNVNLTKLSPLKSTVSLFDQANGYKKTRAHGVKCENAIVGTANYIRSKNPEFPKIIATSCGSDGKTIEQLSKEATLSEYLYGDFLKAINSGAEIAQASGYSINCPAIFWLQGEYNYKVRTGLAPGSSSTIDKDEYKKLLETLKTNMQQDIMNLYNQGAPLFITYQTSGQKWCNTFEAGISMAQLEASNELSDIICAGPVYPVTDRGGHLDPNGYRWYGEMLGKIFNKTVVDGEDFKPLQPKRIRKVDSRKIVIDFHVPVPPLCFELRLQAPVKDYGFEVKDITGRKDIERVNLVGSDAVEILLKEDLIGDVEICYAGKDFNGHGNLRDSDDAVGYALYEDLDKTDSNGEFVFERDASETTLRPDYEPFDGRNTYYGKPYPLHNYCVLFYYKLDYDKDELTVSGFEPSGINEIMDTEKDWEINDLCNGTIIVSQIEGLNSVRVFDIGGMPIATADNDGLIDLSSKSAGIYIIQAKFENGVKYKKYFKNQI